MSQGPKEAGKIFVAHDEGNYVLKLEGDVRLTLCASLNQYLDTIFESEEVEDVIVDLVDTQGIDSTTLGLLAKLALHCRSHFQIKPTIFCVNEDLIQILETMGLDDIYSIIDQTPEKLHNLELLQPVNEDMEQLQRQILEAHKLLVVLKPENKEEFIDLIKCLEEKS